MSLSRHRRRSATWKWTFTALAIALALAWLSNRWYVFAFELAYQSIGFNSGGVQWSHHDWSASPGLHIVLNPVSLHFEWYPKWRHRPDNALLWIPLWISICLTALPATLMWGASIRGLLRKRVGGCASCGYDLQGLPVGSPCPECGTLPVAR